MTKKFPDSEPIGAKKFMEELRRYEKGSVSRRHFLGVTGLGTATAVLAGAMPWLKPRTAEAFGGLGDRLVFSTWPNYHDPKNLERFAELTGVDVLVNVFGSNEEMLAKLQAGGAGWDVFVPTNYTISTYVELDIIEPLDLSKIPTEELGHHRVCGQHRPCQTRHDDVEAVLGPDDDRLLGPDHRARLSAHHDR